MMRKLGVLAVVAALVFAAGSVALSTGGRAEAACPPGDKGCNDANNVLIGIDAASNASTVYYVGGAPIVVVPPAPVIINPCAFNGCGFCGYNALVGCGVCPINGFFPCGLAFAGYCGYFACGFVDEADLLAHGINPYANGPAVPLSVILGSTH